MTDEERLAEIEQRLSAAAPGPWERHDDLVWPTGPAVTDPIAAVAEAYEDSADLIAQAPDDLRYLLDRLAEVEVALARAEALADEWEDAAHAYHHTDPFAVLYRDHADRVRRAALRGDS